MNSAYQYKPFPRTAPQQEYLPGQGGASSQQPGEKAESGFNIKQAIGYTLICGVAVAVGVHYIKKGIQEHKEKKSEAKSFESGTVQNTAKQIDMALHNGVRGADMAQLRYLIGKVKSKEEMDAIAIEYQTQTGNLLFKEMKEKLQDAYYNELVAMNDAKPLKTGQKVIGDAVYKAWAKRFKAAFDYKYLYLFDAVDTAVIDAVFKDIPTQRFFTNVGVAYYKEYKVHLLTDMKEKLHSSAYYHYLKLLSEKPKA